MEEKIESINLSEIILPEDLIRKTPRRLIEEYQFVPISLKDSVLTIALGEFPNQAIINAIEFGTTYKIKIVLASKSDIQRCFKELFSDPKPLKTAFSEKPLKKPITRMTSKSINRLIKDPVTEETPSDYKTCVLAGVSLALGIISISLFFIVNCILHYDWDFFDFFIWVRWMLRVPFFYDMSLILGVFAIVFGIIALIKIEKSAGILRGEGLAIGGIISGGLVVGGFAVRLAFIHL